MKAGKDSFHKMVVVLLVWLGMEWGLVQGSDENIQQNQASCQQVRMERSVGNYAVYLDM